MYWYIFLMTFLKILGFSISYNKDIGLSGMNMYQGFAMYMYVFFAFYFAGFLEEGRSKSISNE